MEVDLSSFLDDFRFLQHRNKIVRIILRQCDAVEAIYFIFSFNNPLLSSNMGPMDQFHIVTHTLWQMN